MFLVDWFDKDAKTVQWKNEQSFQQMLMGLDMHMQEMNLYLYLTTYKKLSQNGSWTYMWK